VQQPCRHLCAGAGDGAVAAGAVVDSFAYFYLGGCLVFPLRNLGSCREEVCFGQRGAWTATHPEATALACSQEQAEQQLQQNVGDAGVSYVLAAALREQRLLWAPALARSTPVGLTVPDQVPGTARAGVGNRPFPAGCFPREQGGTGRCLPPRPPRLTRLRARASAQRGERRGAQACSAAASSRRPLLGSARRGEFSPGLGGGRDVKQAFP